MKLAVHLAPTSETQRRLKLPNSRTCLAARHANDLSKSYFALKALRRTLYGRKHFRYPLSRVWKDVARQLPILLAHAPNSALTLAEVLLNPILIRRDFYLGTVLEPVPNPDSRVSLSQERDQLGLNQVQIDWRLTEQDRDHYAAIGKLVVASLTKSGIALPTSLAWDDAELWPQKLWAAGITWGRPGCLMTPPRG